MRHPGLRAILNRRRGHPSALARLAHISLDMPPKLRLRPQLDEVERRWEALSVDRRQTLMSFDDPMVVESIKVSLQTLYEKQALMHQMGIRVPGVALDQFAASSLFTSAFTLSLQVGRARSDPAVMLVDPSLLPVLVMKPSFLERADFVKALKAVLPDFLSPTLGAVASMGRTPTPRARWKDIFSKEPSSVAALEQQLVRLVEQALWAMAVDPSYAVQCSPSQDLDSPGDVDAWIDEEERNVEAKRKQKKNRRKPAAPLQPTVEEESFGETKTPDEGLATCSTVSAGMQDLLHCSDGLQVATPEGTGGGDFEDGDSPADDGVGTGIFHMADIATTGTMPQTSRPTPFTDHACDSSRGTGLRTPPASPAMRPPQPHSSQLICYIWNQTSQFEQSLDHLPLRKPAAPGGTPDTMSSTPNQSSRSSGAVSRGSWTPATGSPASPSISVVVKNTFVDIDGPCDEAPIERSTQRSSRSMSPSILRHMDNAWRYW